MGVNDVNKNDDGYSSTVDTYVFSPLDPLITSILHKYNVCKESDLRTHINENKDNSAYSAYFSNSFPEDFYKIISFFNNKILFNNIIINKCSNIYSTI